MPEISETPIADIRSQVVTVEAGPAGNSYAESMAMREYLPTLRDAALEFSALHNAPPWLMESLKGMDYVDGIVADMQHVSGGQEFTLHKLKEQVPDLHWYRGGTLKTWGELFGKHGEEYYTPEELATHTIDGGHNGILGQPSVALNFLHLSLRENPVFYSLSLDNLLEGVGSSAIRLTTEHFYDLVINPGDDPRSYVKFCQDNLSIQRVKMD